MVSKSTHIFCKRILLGKYEPKKQLGNYNIAASIFGPPYVYISSSTYMKGSLMHLGIAKIHNLRKKHVKRVLSLSLKETSDLNQSSIQSKGDLLDGLNNKLAIYQTGRIA